MKIVAPMDPDYRFADFAVIARREGVPHFLLQFFLVQPGESPDGSVHTNAVARLVMTPAMLAKVGHLIEQQLAHYEKETGARPKPVPEEYH